MTPTNWREEFDEKFGKAVNIFPSAGQSSLQMDLKDFTTSLLVSLKEQIDATTHTPVDSAAYLDAVRNAKHPFDDGCNHGRETAYAHVEDIISKAIEGK